MHRYIVVFSAFGAAITAAIVIAQPMVAQNIPVGPPPVTTTQPRISVVGEGIVTATPDVARVTIGADVQNQSLSAAIADASTRMAGVIAQLKSAGVADQDIRTINFSVNPIYNNQNNQQTLTGYAVQNMVQARITNIPGLGSLIDTVVGAGATRVYAIGFESSDPASLKGQARDQAMQDAQAKAQQLAKDAGVSLGSVVNIQESDASGVNPVSATRASAVPSLAAAAPTTPIQPGQLQVSTTVNVVWSIK